MKGADLRSPFAADTWRALTLDPPGAPPQPPPPGIWSGLGAALRDFAPAALGETLRSAYRWVTSGADDVMRRQQQEVDEFTAEAILRRRVELDEERARTDAKLRDFVRRFTPDPATTGAGSQVIYGFGKVMTKAIPAVVAAGPIGGAVITGGLEGGAEMQRLEDRGVDSATAARAGVATGALTAVGFALPAAGSTLARTAALAAAGGPGGFMAQQAAVSYILDHADYGQIAQQYDPFDPVGLAVSTLAAGAFGAAGMAAARRAARPVRVDPEAEAAARAVALSDQAASTGLHAPADLDGAVQHLDALATAARQMEQGKPVDVADRVAVDPARAMQYVEMREQLRQALEAEQAAGRIDDAVDRGAVRSEASAQRPGDLATAQPAEPRTRPPTPAAPPSIELQAALDRASSLLRGGTAAEVVGKMKAAGEDVSPLLQNALIAVEEAGPARLDLLKQHAAALAADSKAPAFELVAQAAERVRDGAPVPPRGPDPLGDALARIERTAPGATEIRLVDDAGRQMTGRELIEQAVREASSDMDEASLLRVAAECFIATGG